MSNHGSFDRLVKRRSVALLQEVLSFAYGNYASALNFFVSSIAPFLRSLCF